MRSTISVYELYNETSYENVTISHIITIIIVHHPNRLYKLNHIDSAVFDARRCNNNNNTFFVHQHHRPAQLLPCNHFESRTFFFLTFDWFPSPAQKSCARGIWTVVGKNTAVESSAQYNTTMRNIIKHRHTPHCTVASLEYYYGGRYYPKTAILRHYIIKMCKFAANTNYCFWFKWKHQH